MKTLKICDVTLSELKNEGISLSFKEQLEIAKNLSDLKVDYIQFPNAYGDKSEEVLVKTACACIKGSGIAIEVGDSLESIEGNFKLLSSAKNKRLVVSVPVSPVQMEYHVAKKPKAVLELLSNLVKKCVSLCDNVEVCLKDATRAEPEFLAESIKVAISNGAKIITVSDDSGNILPCEFNRIIEGLKKSVPEIKDLSIAVKTSDAFSLAVSNIFAGIEAGVSELKLSAGETACSDFIKTFLAIENVGVKKGFGVSVNKTAVSRTVKRISDIAQKKEGVILGGSNGSDETLSNKITLSALSKTVKKRGYELSEDEMKTVLSEVVRLSTKKAVNLKELDVIIATTVLQVPPTYNLVSFSVQTSNVLTATASIVLSKDGKELSGLSYGNGCVDAAFLALEEIIGKHFELDDFELGAVTEGKEAMGQALVALRSNGKIYSGRGVSTDIVGASIRAYINAVNKIVYEEKNK